MLAVRPVREKETSVAEFPVTVPGVALTLEQLARLEAVPQQNVTAVEAPFAFTSPFKVAVVMATSVAADVVTPGADATTEGDTRKIHSTGDAGA